jgi:hypothetical protein
MSKKLATTMVVVICVAVTCVVVTCVEWTNINTLVKKDIMMTVITISTANLNNIPPVKHTP